jgi:hypothetical protein
MAHPLLDEMFQKNLAYLLGLLFGAVAFLFFGATRCCGGFFAPPSSAVKVLPCIGMKF